MSLKHFPPLRTKRLTVQLRELTLGESITIASMPVHLHESVTTAFLRAAVKSATGEADPARWTIQERMFAVCHYLASVLEDGPDFSLGSSKYSDYLDGASDVSRSIELVDIGEVGGDKWQMRHITGDMAESIERISGLVPGASGRLHWTVGGMAAQLVREGEDVPAPSDGEGEFDDWLANRMQIIINFPASDAEALMYCFAHGRQKLHHLFSIACDDTGFLAMPKEGAAAELPPARFPVRSCLSRVVLEMVGVAD